MSQENWELATDAPVSGRVAFSQSLIKPPSGRDMLALLCCPIAYQYAEAVKSAQKRGSQVFCVCSHTHTDAHPGMLRKAASERTLKAWKFSGQSQPVGQDALIQWEPRSKRNPWLIDRGSDKSFRFVGDTPQRMGST